MTGKRINVLRALNALAQGKITAKVSTYEIAQQAEMSVLAVHNILMAMSEGECTHYVRRHRLHNCSVSGGAYKHGWSITFAGLQIAKQEVK